MVQASLFLFSVSLQSCFASISISQLLLTDLSPHRRAGHPVIQSRWASCSGSSRPCGPTRALFPGVHPELECPLLHYELTSTAFASTVCTFSAPSLPLLLHDDPLYLVNVMLEWKSRCGLIVAQCAAFTASDGQTPGFASPSRMKQAKRGDEVVSSKCPVSAALRSWAIQRD